MLMRQPKKIDLNRNSFTNKKKLLQKKFKMYKKQIMIISMKFTFKNNNDHTKMRKSLNLYKERKLLKSILSVKM